MITIIAGSREIDDYDEVCNAIRLSGFNITKVISGGARGVDRLGERYARANKIPCKVINAEWDSFGKAAGHKRNMKMAHEAKALIAVYNFRSPGTWNMIRTAIRFGLKVHIHASEAFLEMYSSDFRYVLRFSIKNGRFFVTVDDQEAYIPTVFSVELGLFSLNKIKNWSRRLNDMIIESSMADPTSQSLIRLAFHGSRLETFYCEVKLPELDKSHNFAFNLRSRVYRRNRKTFDRYLEQLRCMAQTSARFLDDKRGEL